MRLSKIRARVTSALAAVVLAAVATPSLAAIRTGDWTGDFSVPAFDGPVRAAAIRDGQYFVAGDFRWAGGVRAQNVAKWTGEAWAPVGAGLQAPVNRLALWGTDLLAASTFGGAAVMRFDGVSWRPLGPDLYGEAQALLVDGPDVYVAGSLLQPGTTNGERVLRWDGSMWQPIGGTFDGRILTLAFYQGELYAGGEFVMAEDQFVSRIARWDGTHWQPVGGGTSGGGGVAVNALTVYGGRLIAGGYFTGLGGSPIHGIGAWNGTVWDSLPETPKDAWVTDLQVEGSLLHVAGVLQVPNQWASGLVTFDGQTWRPPTPYPSWSIQDVALEGGAMMAVGDASQLSYGTPPGSSSPVRDVIVRDPTWKPLFGWKPTMRGLFGPSWTEVMTLHSHRGALYAGGYFEYATSGPSITYTGSLVRWTGSDWVSVGNLRGWVRRIASWGDRLVAGGGGGFSSDNGTYTSVVAWDGTGWGDLGGPLEGGVNGMTEWQGALVAAGEVRLPGQTGWSGVAVHRTSGWQILGELPITDDQTTVTDVATFQGQLYVAGSGLDLPGGPYGVLQWDGTRWAAVPNAPEGGARMLLPRQDGLWVAFSRPVFSGGTVWRWDGAHWTQMGDLVGDNIVLAEAGGEVVAAGLLFTPLRPCTLARWTGTEWIPILNGPRNGVETMTTLDNDLYVGGSFRSTELQQSEGLARWSFETVTVAPSIPSIETWPSPARDRLTFRFSATSAARARVEIYDLHGARLATPVDEVVPAGDSERSWAIPASRMPAGVYFARVRLGATTWGRRIVVVR